MFVVPIVGPIIEVDKLSKTFEVPVREQGLRASIRSLVHRETKEVTAVDAVSFTIEPGEVVGFLGPNGAGKTTTLKMLSGLLHPTGGRCRVLGLEPTGRPVLAQPTPMPRQSAPIQPLPQAPVYAPSSIPGQRFPQSLQSPGTFQEAGGQRVVPR